MDAMNKDAGEYGLDFAVFTLKVTLTFPESVTADTAVWTKYIQVQDRGTWELSTIFD